MSMSIPHFTGQHYDGEASGPFPFLNPTTRRFPLSSGNKQSSQDTLGSLNATIENPSQAGSTPKDEVRAEDVQQKWRSRDNRKGRHAISITPALHKNAQFVTPEPTSAPREILRGIWRMFTTYPYWDVSYLVALVFTIGSIIWCINAFFVWLPLADPSSEFPGEEADGGGWTAFIGATVFEFGSVLLMLEAVNENRADCFGWALEEALEERGLIRLRASDCTHHHHQNRRNFVGKGKGKSSGGELEHNTTMEPTDQPKSKNARTWTWWPSWYELKTHYIKEVGFLACSFQMFGAAVFWISGFTALPKIQDALTTPSALNGAFWVPQVIGGSGFIVSGILFMIETQQKWYLPAYTVLGWHIGAWNLLGGIGFTLCGALGFAASSNSGVAYQSSLATFWGSWAFLIGSVIQLFESLDKHPVDIETGGGRVADTQPVA